MPAGMIKKWCYLTGLSLITPIYLDERSSCKYVHHNHPPSRGPVTTWVCGNMRITTYADQITYNFKVPGGINLPLRSTEEYEQWNRILNRKV